MTCFTIVSKARLMCKKYKSKEDAFDNVVLELSFLLYRGWI